MRSGVPWPDSLVADLDTNAVIRPDYIVRIEKGKAIALDGLPVRPAGQYSASDELTLDASACNGTIRL